MIIERLPQLGFYECALVAQDQIQTKEIIPTLVRNIEPVPCKTQTCRKCM